MAEKLSLSRLIKDRLLPYLMGSIFVDMEGEITSLWPALLEIIIPLFSGGGVIYLLIQGWLERKKNREEIKSHQVENVEKTVSYGIPMIEIYKEIDKIVDSKTSPILAELKTTREEMETLKNTYCCYREICDMRMRTKDDAFNKNMIHEDWIKKINDDRAKSDS